MLMEIMSCRQYKTIDAGILNYLISEERSTLFEKLYRIAGMNTRRMRMVYKNLTGVTLRLNAASATWSTLQLKTKLPSDVLDCILDFLVEDAGAFDLRDYEDHFLIDMKRASKWIKRGDATARLNLDGNFDRRVAEACQTDDKVKRIANSSVRL